MAIGLALLGAGLFVQDAHLAPILSSTDLELRAVYSRSLKSASEVAPDRPLDRYADEGPQGLEALLARSDIQAVIVVLPILVQPKYIRTALEAGKHVLSEKPIAENVAEAFELIQWYRSSGIAAKVTWCVAENFRYWASLDYAKSILSQLGQVRHFGIHVNINVGPEWSFWKYFETYWRKDPKHQGGFMLDVGVHFAAGARSLLAVANHRISNVLALGASTRDLIRPMDTLDGIMRLENGVQGTLHMSASSSLRGTGWTITGEHGSITILDMQGGIGDTAVTARINGQEEVRHLPMADIGVAAELQAWGAALAQGRVNEQQIPEEALADLELIELMLKSHAEEGRLQTTQHQDVKK